MQQSFIDKLNFYTLTSKTGSDWDQQSAKAICDQFKPLSYGNSLLIYFIKDFGQKFPKQQDVLELDWLDAENILSGECLFDYKRTSSKPDNDLQGKAYLSIASNIGTPASENDVQFFAIAEKDDSNNALIRGIWAINNGNVFIAPNPIYKTYTPITTKTGLQKFESEHNDTTVLRNTIDTFLQQQQKGN